MTEKTKIAIREDTERLIKWMTDNHIEPDRYLIRNYEKYLYRQVLASKSIARFIIYATKYAKRTWPTIGFMKPDITKGKSIRKQNQFTMDQIRKISKYPENTYQCDIFTDWVNGISRKVMNEKYKVINVFGNITEWIKKVGLYPEYKAGDIRNGILVSPDDIRIMLIEMKITKEEVRNGYGYNK